MYTILQIHQMEYKIANTRCSKSLFILSKQNNNQVITKYLPSPQLLKDYNIFSQIFKGLK